MSRKCQNPGSILRCKMMLARSESGIRFLVADNGVPCANIIVAFKTAIQYPIVLVIIIFHY